MVPRRWLLWAVPGLGLATGLCALLGIVRPFGLRFFDDAAFWLFLELLIASSCLGVSWAFTRRHFRPLMIAGMLGGMITAGGTLLVGLDDVFDVLAIPYPALLSVERSLGTLSLVLAVALHWGLVSMLRLDGRGWRRLRTISRYALFVPIVVIALVICEFRWMRDEFELWLEFMGMGRIYDLEARLTFFTVIPELCLTGLLPFGAILGAWARRAEHQELISVPHVSMQCPTCSTPLTLKDGQGWCGHCGLHIRVEVEPPRCTCGYMMFHNQSATCPECGNELQFRRDAVRADTYSAPPANGR